MCGTVPARHGESSREMNQGRAESRKLNFARNQEKPATGYAKAKSDMPGTLLAGMRKLNLQKNCEKCPALFLPAYRR
ncbi:unnamed protein product, partial [Mesorhabditis spiculigera]